MTLCRVEAKHFVAGLVVADERIVKAAPILRWTLGRPLVWFEEYARGRGWSVELVA